MVVWEDELVVILQEPSPSAANDETLQKDRAALRGTTAKRLAAHCRLIAAISESDGVGLLLSASLSTLDDELIATAFAEDDASVVGAGGADARPPLPPLLLLVASLVAAVALAPSEIG